MLGDFHELAGQTPPLGTGRHGQRSDHEHVRRQLDGDVAQDFAVFLDDPAIGALQAAGGKIHSFQQARDGWKIFRIAFPDVHGVSITDGQKTLWERTFPGLARIDWALNGRVFWA